MVATTTFTARPTAIDGLLVFEVSRVDDERGSFQEWYQFEKLTAAGMPEHFRPLGGNFSRNNTAGVTRGLHAEPWNKYITVVDGEVFAAYVDLRPGSGFGQLVTVKIDCFTSVFLPRGVANSFQTLKPTTYSYLIDDVWRPGNYDAYTYVNLGDSQLDIDWPIDLGEAIVSERDRNHPMLADITPMEIPHG